MTSCQGLWIHFLVHVPSLRLQHTWFVHWIPLFLMDRMMRESPILWIRSCHLRHHGILWMKSRNFGSYPKFLDPRQIAQIVRAKRESLELNECSQAGYAYKSHILLPQFTEKLFNLDQPWRTDSILFLESMNHAIRVGFLRIKQTDQSPTDVQITWAISYASVRLNPSFAVHG